MRIEAADGTLITLVSEMVDEKVREKKESYLKATILIPLVRDASPDPSDGRAHHAHGLPSLDERCGCAQQAAARRCVNGRCLQMVLIV